MLSSHDHRAGWAGFWMCDDQFVFTFAEMDAFEADRINNLKLPERINMI